MALVKCQICDQKDEKNLMYQETNKKYYHIKICHAKYIEIQEFKKLENEKWSLLYEYIKSLHDVLIVPPRNIKRLQELRNGFDFKGGKRIQKYRQGISFELMLESYKISEEKIKWFIRDVLKGEKGAEDINKCITMMLNSLNVAWAKEQHRIKHKEDLIKNKPDDLITDENVTYSRKEVASKDISDFL